MALVFLSRRPQKVLETKCQCYNNDNGKPFKAFLVSVDPKEVDLFENSETVVQQQTLGGKWESGFR